MIQPQYDDKLKAELKTIISGIVTEFSRLSETQLSGYIDKQVDLIVAKMDNRGYHVGLPSDIEWALNSGDGTYRP